MKNIPNIISAIRILLVPVFVLTFLMGGDNGGFWAAMVFLAAALSDFLDGFLARKLNCTSELGRILDPAGDKLMTLAMVTCLAVREIIPAWVPLFFLIKEVLMLTGGLLIHGKIKLEMPASNIIGKTATFFLFCVGLILMLFDVTPSAASWLMVLAVLLTSAAFVSYLIMFAGIWKKRKSQ